jgi:excisionase family DNA binding protein
MAKNVRDLAAVLGCGYTAAVSAIESGQAPGYKVGKSWRIPDDAFEAFKRGEWKPQPIRIEIVHPVTPGSLVQRREALATQKS